MDQMNTNLGRRIKVLREALTMSQERLASLLGVSRPTVSQIENDERKISAEELVKLTKIFNTSVESLIDPTKTPLVVLKDVEKPKKMESKGIRISVPQKNIKKFKEVLLYLLSKIGSLPNVGETVIYKIFYFIDFDFYEMYEEQLIGATYQKNHHGPTPIEFAKIVDQMIANHEIEKVKSEYFNFPQTKYLPLRPPDLKVLKANEVDLINQVINRFADWNASRISEYSHNDVPWMTTEEGEIISYESVFYRTAPYSVRNYSE